MISMDVYDFVNPLDYRYYSKSKNFKQLSEYFSERAKVLYQLKVEEAIVKVLSKRGMCSLKVANEVSRAIKKVKIDEVYLEEDRIKHDIRALVNNIKKHVSKEAKPYIHFTATSYDIVSTSDAMRIKEGVLNVILPILKDLEKTLIELCLREKHTIQIGRTHGQHAEPMTFGFALSEYVSRLGFRIERIEIDAINLKGKISGAIGAYNSSALFFSDPEKFEKEVLKELNLEPSTHSTQIVEPEFLTDLVHSIISTFGVLANLADDMRQLQRSEIGEIGEKFDSSQVGSSTMPHKRNPINFENAKSFFLEYSPRMITRYLNQISEHQRDLTNSASGRFVPEIIVGLALTAERINNVMKKIVVDKVNMQNNFDKNKEMIVAEPAYLLLAAYGHPDAHEHIKQLTLKSQKDKTSLKELIFSDKSLEVYLKKFTKDQLNILRTPEKYVGIASKKTENVCAFWQKKLNI